MNERPVVAPDTVVIRGAGWRRGRGGALLATLLLLAGVVAGVALADGEMARALVALAFAGVMGVLLWLELRRTAAERAAGHALRLDRNGIACLHFPLIPWRAVRDISLREQPVGGPLLVLALERRTHAWLARQVEGARRDRRWRLEEDDSVVFQLAGLDHPGPDVLALARQQQTRFGGAGDAGAARQAARGQASPLPEIDTRQTAQSHG